MAKEMLRLERLHDDLKAMTGLNVFGVDIGKDEVDTNPSFFIFTKKGPIRKDTESMNLLREFVLMFVTREDLEIDEYKIIEESNKWGLRFSHTEYDYGKMSNTQEIVQTTTFYFNQVVKLCRAE